MLYVPAGDMDNGINLLEYYQQFNKNFIYNFKICCCMLLISILFFLSVIGVLMIWIFIEFHQGFPGNFS